MVQQHSTEGSLDELPPPVTRARALAARAFYCYRVFSRSYFHLPVLWVWLVEGHGVRIWAAAALLAVYSATLTFGAPLATRLRRWLPGTRSMVAGEVIKVAGLLGLVFAGGNIAGIAAAQLVGGIGYSLAQGPDSVLLRSLYRDNEASEYSEHESRSMSLVFVAVLLAGVAGGYLYSWHPAAPFIASTCTCALAIAAAIVMGRLAAATGLTMTGSGPTAPAGGAPAAPEPARVRPRLASITATDWQWMAYYAMVRGLAVAAFVALLPMLFFVDLRVQVSMFGIVLGSFSLFAYLSGRYGTQVVKSLPDVAVPLISAVVLAGSFALFAAANVLGVALAGMALLGAANGVVRPLAMSRLQSVPNRSAAQRGFVVATMERCYGSFNALAVIAGGLIADLANAQDALWTYAIGSGALGVLWFIVLAGKRRA
jgi:MFS family permease